MALASEVVRADDTAPVRHEWEAQVDLVRRTVAAGASEDEFQLFLHQARRTGLDPLARQIYCIVRGKGANAKAMIQVGIDGFRLVADRTGRYVGNTDATFDGEETSKWQSYDKSGQFSHPLKATVTVRKLVSGQGGDIVGEFTATARWSEYYPGDVQGSMWRKMPHTMLAKVAEALALRKAFPADLSGVHTDAEMDQADVIDAEYRDRSEEVAPSGKPGPKADPAAIPAAPKEVHAGSAFLLALGMTEVQAKAYVAKCKDASLTPRDFALVAQQEGVGNYDELDTFLDAALMKVNVEPALEGAALLKAIQDAFAEPTKAGGAG